MKENTAKNRIPKKTAVIILIAVVAVALIAISAGVAGHTVYLNNQKALITNEDTDFSVTSPHTLTYYYANGVKSVDLNGIVEVSKGASFSVIKLKDEDGSVVKPDGNTVDVSVKSQRLAQVKVVSKSGKASTDYRITVAPKSTEGNVISYNVGGGTLDLDEVLTHYSGETDVDLPTPVKTFTGGSGNTVNFDFQGWYTTENYAEGTEISSIPAGTKGGVELYAKFAEHTMKKAADGYTYFYFGSYPQNQVTSYNRLVEIRESSDYINAANGEQFSYDGKQYVKFVPSNYPNVSDNGYSSNATYVFEVNPVEWRVLKPKNYNVTNGEQLDLLATSVLNCAPYGEDAGAIQNYYNKIASKIGDIDSFIRYYFESDTAYEKSKVKVAVDSMSDAIFKDAADKNKIVQRSFSYYNNALGNGTKSYSCSLWLLNYSEAINTNYGFENDYTVNDPLRKAMVTDFGAANGAYRSTSRAYAGQGSWWLRGAGDYQDNGKNGANGDKEIGYNFRAKRIGYVKYTGYVHTYTSLNMTLRSGIRPAVRITYDSSYFTAS